jgi:hypothetical protein
MPAVQANGAQAYRRRGRGAVRILVGLAFTALAGRALAGPPADKADAQADKADAQPGKEEADRLFDEGKELLRQGDLTAACEKLERSLALLRRSGTLLNLARCREMQGNLATAAKRYQEALDIATRDGKTDRQELARQQLDALRPKLSWLTITPPGGEIPGLVIACDGEALPPDRWGAPMPVDPGEHVVTTSAPGRATSETRVTVGAVADRVAVRIPAPGALPAARPAEAAKLAEIAPTRAPGSLREGSPREGSPREGSPREEPGSLTHRLRFGATARADVDGIRPGARAAVGLTFGVDDHLEIGASALLGRDLGAEPRLTFFLFERSAWKPLLDAGLPIFFSADGAHAGVRGAAGVQWDVNAHFGLFAQLGGAYFPSPQKGVAGAVLLHSIGVQGRI